MSWPEHSKADTKEEAVEQAKKMENDCWIDAEHTIEVPTNAYGEILFNEDIETRAQVLSFRYLLILEFSLL